MNTNREGLELDTRPLTSEAVTAQFSQRVLLAGMVAELERAPNPSLLVIEL
jgi:hypothetical protein